MDQQQSDFASTRAPDDAASPPPSPTRSLPRRAGRWVESSWDLQRGLSVREGLPADVGLDEWIDALLRGG